MGYIVNLAGKLSVNGFDEFGFCGWIMRVLVLFSLFVRVYFERFSLFSFFKACFVCVFEF